VPVAKIIANAVVPKKPEMMTNMILMGLGFLMGGFLSTTAILLLEMRDKSLKIVKSVTNLNQVLQSASELAFEDQLYLADAIKSGSLVVYKTPEQD
jgi:hypothetical protein